MRRSESPPESLTEAAHSGEVRDAERMVSVKNGIPFDVTDAIQTGISFPSSFRLLDNVSVNETLAETEPHEALGFIRVTPYPH